MAEGSVQNVKDLEEEPSIVTPEIVRDLLDRAHEIAVKTSSEVLIILTSGDVVTSYASPGLKPLVRQESGRAMIAKCLVEKLQKGLLGSLKAGMQEDEAVVFGRKRNMTDHQPIKDDDEATAFLKKAFMELRDKFIDLTKPGNPKGEEGLLIVATLANQLLCVASPMLNPMIETGAGFRTITTLLNNARDARRRGIPLPDDDGDEDEPEEAATEGQAK